MTAPQSIRAARVELALALMGASDRAAEAASEFRHALRETGDVPPDWRIHLHLGVLARAANDSVQAFTELLAAVLTSPPDTVDEPATDAASMLDDKRAARRWATKLDGETVSALVDRARSDDASPRVVALAAELLVLRGDAATANSLIREGADVGVESSAVAQAHAVAQALERVEAGQFDSALELLEESEISPSEPAAASTRALALYGAGLFDDALDAVADVPETFETAVTQALVYLRQASDLGSAAGSDAVAEAARAASTAARLAPSRGEGLLLRAQVKLEGESDIEAGRRLLESAIRKLDRDPERARFWRLQQRVRHDDRFRYMTLEVAAACGRNDELLAMSLDDLLLEDTSYTQDAALAELKARALLQAERPDESAEAFEKAAEFYEYSEQLDLALEASRLASLIRPTVDGLIKLAEDQWLASNRVATHGASAIESTVGDGLAALDRLDESGLEQDASQRIEAAYMRGLLLARRPYYGSATPHVEHWLPLPWLLVAALDDRTHWYRAAHLAWALSDAELTRAALHFAERALSFDQADEWLKECAIVTRVNWYGVLDPETNEMIDATDNGPWGATMRTLDALNRNDMPGARVHFEAGTIDGLWASVIRAQAAAVLDGMEHAEPLFRSLLEEASKEPVDHLVAANAALVLRDPDAARDWANAGESEGFLTARDRLLIAAQADLLASRDARALETLREEIAGTLEPYVAREWAYRRIPVLSLAWREDRETVDTLEQLRGEVEARIDAMPMLPALTFELDEGASSSTDPALDSVVRELLVIEDRGEAIDEDAAKRIRGYAADAKVPLNIEPLVTTAATAR